MKLQRQWSETIIKFLPIAKLAAKIKTDAGVAARAAAASTMPTGLADLGTFQAAATVGALRSLPIHQVVFCSDGGCNRSCPDTCQEYPADFGEIGETKTVQQQVMASLNPLYLTIDLADLIASNFLDCDVNEDYSTS